MKLAPRPRLARVAAGATALAGAFVLLNAAPASAASAPPPGAGDAGVIRPAVVGDRRCVVPDKTYIRNYPAGQAWTQLYHNQTFSVYEYRASGWARGFAWGHVNTDHSPYPAPYDRVWIQTSALGKHVNDGSTC